MDKVNAPFTLAATRPNDFCNTHTHPSQKFYFHPQNHHSFTHTFRLTSTIIHTYTTHTKTTFSLSSYLFLEDLVGPEEGPGWGEGRNFEEKIVVVIVGWLACRRHRTLEPDVNFKQ